MARLPSSATAAIAAEVQRLGFRAIWFPESVGKEPFTLAGLLLAQSELIVATGIATIWVRDATVTANAAKTLAEAYPGRFVLGLGVGHEPFITARGHDYRRPYAAMERYLAEMKSVPFIGKEPKSPAPVLIAALGPRMLALAGSAGEGAHTYLVPVEHTETARRLLGRSAYLAPEQAVVVSEDAAEARAIGRRHVEFYLPLANQRSNLMRLGFGDSDLRHGGSDRLIDALVAWGSVTDVQQRIAAHLEAGADHVAVQILPDRTNQFPMEELRQLAPALAEL